MQEKANKSTHGGRRAGAGRPKTIGSSNTICIRIPDDVARILSKEENKSAYIVEAIRHYAEEQRKHTILGFEISYTKD